MSIQKYHHTCETPRQENVVNSLPIPTVPDPGKEKNFEEIVQGLEKKWEEKFEKQQTVIEKLETQVATLTEFVASIFKFANTSADWEQSSEENAGTLVDNQRQIEEKEETVVSSAEKLDSNSSVVKEVEAKEEKPAWELAIEKLANLTIEGFEKLGQQIAGLEKPSTPIEHVDEIKVDTSKQVKINETQASTSGRSRKRKDDVEYEKFLEVFKKLEINIPLADILEESPQYKKFLKEVMNKKRKMNGRETVMLSQACTEALKDALPLKLNDPGKFTLDCTIGDSRFKNAFCDLGASINLIPFSVAKKLGLGNAIKKTGITIQLADRSIKRPRGMIEDVLLKVDKFIFPVDFVVLDMEEDPEIPFILGRPFMATAGAVIDVKNSKMVLRVGNKELNVNIMKRWKKNPKFTKTDTTSGSRVESCKKRKDKMKASQFNPP